MKCQEVLQISYAGCTSISKIERVAALFFYHQTRTIWLTQPGRFRDADLLKPFWDPLTAVSKPICASKYPSFNVLNFFRTLLDYLNMYHYLGNTHVQNVCCTIFMSSNFTGQGRCLQTCVKLLETCVLPQKQMPRGSKRSIKKRT